MRHLDVVGVEWGLSWIIDHILETELEPVDLNESFEESVRQNYPQETRVGWMTFNTVELMKSNDPISWNCALSEYESQEESEGKIVSFNNGSTFYNTIELEDYLEML